MSQQPSHILIGFTIIGFLTFASQDSFLSAEIKPTTASALIPKPAPAELFIWQQDVGHRIWTMLNKAKSITQKEIINAVRNCEPIFVERFVKWEKGAEQNNYQQEAFISFWKAQRLKIRAKNDDQILFNYVAHFMYYFEQLDDQHKCSLLNDLQKSLNPSSTPHCKKFADYIPNPPAKSTTELNQAITEFIKTCNSLSEEPK
jgi:hypothetical protein